MSDLLDETKDFSKPKTHPWVDEYGQKQLTSFNVYEKILNKDA